jgi:hypothetical protein
VTGAKEGNPMIKLALLVLAEAAIGVALAGVVLAIIIPLLLRFGWIAPGGAAGTAAIVAVLVMAVAVLLFRPGSAINRYTRRGE